MQASALTRMERTAAPAAPAREPAMMESPPMATALAALDEAAEASQAAVALENADAQTGPASVVLEYAEGRARQAVAVLNTAEAPAGAAVAPLSFPPGSHLRRLSSVRVLHPVAPLPGPRDKRSSTAGNLHSFPFSSCVVDTRMTRIVNRRTLVRATINREHRARKRLCVRLHFSGELTDLTSFLDRALSIGDHAD